jgi:RimJ/RimL family protein N-acetyltransferase
MAILIKGDKTGLEEVAAEDAKNICMLRNSPAINKYLSSSEDVSIGQQKAWITQNLRKNDGHYCKIIDLQDNNFCGTASLYNVKNGEAEFGRYICTKPIQAIETELIILKLAFEEMKLRRVYCRTAVENTKVWKQHLRYGFRNAGEESFSNGTKNLTLNVQEITRDIYDSTDYSFISQIIKKF